MTADKPKRRKRISLYPWDDWFSRRGPFVLVKGEDYQIRSYSMAQQFRNQASKRYDRGVTILVGEDRLTIKIVRK